MYNLLKRHIDDSKRDIEYDNIISESITDSEYAEVIGDIESATEDKKVEALLDKIPSDKIVSEDTGEGRITKKDMDELKTQPTPTIEELVESVTVLAEKKLTAEEKKKLDDEDFGIPSERKYPLIDEAHVKSAISYFHSCKEENRETLANNIFIACVKFEMKINKEDQWFKYVNLKKIDKAVKDKAIYK